MRKVVTYILEEDDYSVFKRLDDNRDVLMNRVTKLIASMTEKYVLNPITVNEKMEIIDGQGRFEARKSMGLPIHYYVAKGATSDDCRRMNKYNTKWNSLDFAKSFAKAGNDNYILLLNVCNITKFPISRIARLANRSMDSSHSKIAMTIFQSGRFIFTQDDKKKVLSVKKHGDDVLEALQYKNRPNDMFYVALKICFETPKYNPDRMIEKCKKMRASYAQMSNLLNQLKEFERIYNDGLASKNRLYFSDYMRNRGYSARSYDNYSPYEDADISTLR